MNDDTVAPEGCGVLLGRLWQWCLVILLGVLTLLFALALQDQLRSPGAPVEFFWWATGFLTVTIAIAFPPIFFRLPHLGKVAAYIALFVALIVQMNAISGVTEAYEATPEGAKAAEERKARELQETRRSQAEALAAAQMAERETIRLSNEEKMDRLRSCLSWRGQLSDLNSAIRESLHNPSSFEHVTTEIISGETDRMNVMLTFRAENAFGAIRTEYVRAQLSPDSCDIVRIENY